MLELYSVTGMIGGSENARRFEYLHSLKDFIQQYKGHGTIVGAPVLYGKYEGTANFDLLKELSFHAPIYYVDNENCIHLFVHGVRCLGEYKGQVSPGRIIQLRPHIDVVEFATEHSPETKPFKAMRKWYNPKFLEEFWEFLNFWNVHPGATPRLSSYFDRRILEREAWFEEVFQVSYSLFKERFK